MKPKEILETSVLLSDRVRLLIMVTLAAAKNPPDFTYLVNHLELTKGNLSTHIQKLENEKYINVHKEFINKKPKTTYTITKEGKTALKNYLQMIENILKQGK